MDKAPVSAGSSKRYISSACSSLVVLVCLPAILVQTVFCFRTNNELQKVTKIGVLEGPEDICVDKNGVMYIATRDGWIKKVYTNETVKDWKFAGGSGLLGLAYSAAGNILACDTHKGLLKISEDGVEVLTSEVNNTKIRFADDVIEAWDGTVYFSDASWKYGLEDWFEDVKEGIPHGKLLKYDPSTKETSIVLSDLAFANGVALSPDQSYLLDGRKKKGTTEIFIDKLSGAPDNINLAPDGTYWIALLDLTTTGVGKKSSVVNVRADGKIMKKLDDPNGKVMTMVTSAFEFENKLYLGSLKASFIGKYSLEDR